MHSKKGSDWDRLESVLEWANLNTNSFAREIGLPRAENLYQIKRGNNGISRRLADMIVTRYPELDMAWLLTGEGGMFFNKELRGASIPFFNADVEGALSECNPLDPSTMLLLPPSIVGDFAMLYTGRAMGDITPPNSVVVLKKIEPNMIVPGNEYVVLTKKVVLLRLVRYNFGASTPSIRLIPIERDSYDEVIFELKDVLAIYHVTAKIISAA